MVAPLPARGIGGCETADTPPPGEGTAQHLERGRVTRSELAT
jgi:hypothetical protein